MATSEQPSHLPIPPASASADPGPPNGTRALTAVSSIGIVLVILTGAISLLGDWLAGWQLTRPWSQISATLAGGFLLVAASIRSTVSLPQRVIIGIGGIMVLLAVLDSLDGAQDVLSLVVVLLMAWALVYANTTVQVLRGDRPLTRRRRLAIMLGLFATVGYLSVAGYYLAINLTNGPAIAGQHLLYGLGFPVSMLLNWLGGLSPAAGPLTGRVRICLACGLRNIPERRTCKRCGGLLGPIEHVS